MTNTSCQQQRKLVGCKQADEGASNPLTTLARLVIWNLTIIMWYKHMWTIQTGERQWKENRCVWYEGEVCSQASELGWILTAPKEHRIYLQRCCFITNSFTVSKVHSEMTFWMCCTSQPGLVLMNLVLWCVCKCSHHHITSHSIFFLHAVCIFSETKERLWHATSWHQQTGLQGV